MVDGNKLILIVDDEPKNIQVLGAILRASNYNIAVAKDGEQAIRILEGGLSPDLIFLDVNMPGIDGYETCVRIKEKDLYEDIPVIFITANSEADDIIKGFEAGGVDYVIKPFQTKELLHRISTHIKLKITKDELERSMLEKQAVLNILKKEMTPPIDTLYNLSVIILENPEDLNSFAVTLRETANKTLTLIKYINSIIDSMSGNFQIANIPQNLVKLIDDSILAIKKFADNKNIKLIDEVRPNVVVSVDEFYFSNMILDPLLHNAIKFTPEGGKVRISHETVPNYEVITIEDTGIGIPSELKPLILTSNHLEALRLGTNNESGSGFGLYLVKRFIELHGGSIKIISRDQDHPLGSGTSIIIKIPIQI